MDAPALRERVEEAKRTELDRLDSDAFIVALTDDDASTDAVLRAAADSEHAAYTTFAAWADREDDPAARELFGWVADRETEHRDRVLDALDAEHDPNDGGTVHSYLRQRTNTVERAAAGLVGRPLVSVRAHRRILDYFTSEADTRRANLFRDLETETAEELERGLAYLDDHCENEADWEAAQMVAEYVVQLAYDDYADSLRGLGIDPGR